ncbi:MAG TPA: hypothetical protein VGV38_19220, partial [Pyrinomonadaceae bacterium]|nr:hypothetical protein [Pyrinomonadaceae bacterium]
FSNPADLDAFSLRLDHNAGSKLLLHARYHLADSDARARGAGGFSANTVQAVGGRAQSFTGSASYTISSTAVTDLRANYTRNTVRGSYRLDDFGGARVSTEPFLSDALSRPDFGFLFDLGARGAALRTGGEAASTQRQLNFVGSLSLLRGEHALKLGADYRRLSPVIGLRSFEQHVFFDGVAQALTGTAARDGRFTRTGPREPVFQNLSVYAQDEWRLSSRLTLTYGLRWELNPAPRNSDGPDAPAFTQTDDPTRLSPAAPGAPLWRTTYGNLAPRAGLAFGLDEEMRTIFRAGFGLFYDMGQSEAGDAFADSFPFLDGAARFNAPFTVADSFPVTTTGAPVVVPVSAFDPRLKLPYAWRWSLAVERAVAGNNSVGARYVGSAGRRLLSTRTLLDQSADFPFLRLTTNGAESEHHSLQFTFDRRLARGLEAHASYTLSKTHDTATQDTAARALLRADNPRLERGPSDFDARHLFSGFATYELPAPFADGLANALSRRWALDAVFHARSARPVNVLYAFPTAYGLAYLRPDLVEGAPLYLEDPTTPGGRRINPAAFSAPAGFRQGTLARNALRGFALQQLDLALRRSFNFTDSVRLTLRAEAFNLLNHPNFEEPSGTEATLGHLDPTSGTFRANSTFGQTLSAYGRSFWSGQGGGFGPFNSQGGPRTLQFSVKLAF